MAEAAAEAKWYVVHTYSGYENKVKADLEMTIENRKLQDTILEVAVPLSQEEVDRMGIHNENLVIDFKVGDTVTVISGVWEGTAGVIKTINEGKQSVTIHVDMFGRPTPVELAFTEVKRM